MVYLLNMVIFHGELLNNQMVSNQFWPIPKSTMQPLVYLPDLPGGPAQSRPGPWNFHRELGECIGVNGDLAVDG